MELFSLLEYSQNQSHEYTNLFSFLQGGQQHSVLISSALYGVRGEAPKG